MSTTKFKDLIKDKYIPSFTVNFIFFINISFNIVNPQSK